AYVGNGASAKAKVYCEKCYNADIISLGLSDQNDVQNNRRVHCHTEDELKEHLWSTDEAAERGWCHLASTTLLGHLCHCTRGISDKSYNRAVISQT
ncbi:hypothetical protein PAXRUDRAFT_180265, partial [Paxillus rubicundulus Ve08.2h10]